MSRRASSLLKLPGADGERGICASGLINEALPPGDLLIYGFGGDASDALRVSKALGSPLTVAPVAGSQSLEWTERAHVLAIELERYTLGLELPENLFATFQLSADLLARAEILACVAGRPWFVRFKSGERWIYLLGLTDIPDADLVVSSAAQELPLVSGFVALLLFVRAHYRSQAWAAPETLGNFIIDDPLLRPRYGFVNHAQLAEDVKRASGAATIAFIPWNARRTNERTAALYRSGEGLGICVHGYEHIDEEFSTLERDDLLWRADRALADMRLHEELSGVPFDPVMVFPQGRFSSRAMEALESAGFLAAANSTFLSADTNGRVRLKHLVEPAVSAYSAAPLFRRRAPEYLDRFRYDALLGKPLLLVEHHAYFRDSGAAFRCVFQRVRDCVPQVRWTRLGEIVRKACLVRQPRPDVQQVRFYAPRFECRVLEAGTYEFERPHVGPVPRAVTIDGRDVDYVLDADTLRFAAALAPSLKPAEVVVETAARADEVPVPARRRTTRLSVAARRYLSEARDNWFAVTRAALTARATSVRVPEGSR